MKPRRTDSRTVLLGAKFSKAEAHDLRRKAHASGGSLSTLLRGLAISGVVYPRPQIDPVAIEQWRALAPLAANLNQLTRIIHQGQILKGQDVLDELLALRCVLSEIRNSLIGEECSSP